MFYFENACKISITELTFKIVLLELL